MPCPKNADNLNDARTHTLTLQRQFADRNLAALESTVSASRYLLYTTCFLRNRGSRVGAIPARLDFPSIVENASLGLLE